MNVVFLDMGDTVVNISDFVKNKSVQANIEAFKDKGHEIGEKDMEKAIEKTRNFIEEKYLGSPEKYVPGVFTGKMVEFLGLEIDEDVVVEISRIYNEKLINNVYLNEGSMELLDWLEENNYTTVMISNGDTYSINRIVDVLEIRDYFEMIITSENCGAEKSTSIPFKIAMDSLGIKPEDAIMVGDRIDEDVLGAKKLGIKSIFLKGSIWELRNYSKQEIEPDYTIEKIIEVKKILEELNANNNN